MNGLVGLADYPLDSPVHGALDHEHLASLSKALTTDAGIVAEGATGGQAFRAQSLEGTLKLATEKSEKELVLWPKIAKDPAFSTTIEYTRQEDWGEEPNFFLSETGSPDEDDATYKRLVGLIKFMAVKKEVSLASTLVKSIVNPMAQKAHEGTLQLLRGIEQSLVYGDSDINSLAFDGFLKQIDDAATGANSDIVLDWEGEVPSEGMLQKAAKRVSDHIGYLDFLLLGNQAYSDLVETMFPKGRVAQPLPNPTGEFGIALQKWNARFSTMEVKPSRYIKTFAPRSTGMTGAPTAPDAVVCDKTSDTDTKLDAGTTYYYWVSIAYRGKESAAYAGSYAAVAAYSNTVTLVDAKFTNATDYMIVYRSTVDDISTATRIGTVPRGKTRATDGSLSTSTNTTYIDGNQTRDNCTDAIGFTWDPEVLTVKQLAPLMKLDLAQVTHTLPFMLLIYLAPILYVPTKCVHIKNIGILPVGS